MHRRSISESQRHRGSLALHHRSATMSADTDAQDSLQRNSAKTKWGKTGVDTENTKSCRIKATDSQSAADKHQITYRPTSHHHPVIYRAQKRHEPQPYSSGKKRKTASTNLQREELHLSVCAPVCLREELHLSVCRMRGCCNSREGGRLLYIPGCGASAVNNNLLINKRTEKHEQQRSLHTPHSVVCNELRLLQED